MSVWLTIAAMGAVTYAVRLSVLVFVSHASLPGAFREALRFVLPAVLAAIILPALLYVGDDESLRVSVWNDRLVAALIATAVAYAARNVWTTVTTGMVVLWLLQSAG
jgi:branched-subunit amino acid transport protein